MAHTTSSDAQQAPSDWVQSFHIENTRVRGVITVLPKAWRNLIEAIAYPEPVLPWLGQTLAANALFAGDIKMAGTVSIQLRSEGNLRTVFTECTANGAVRGIAQYQDPEKIPVTIDDLGPKALLAITIEPNRGSLRQQSLVPLEGHHLSEAFEAYFARSEQLPTVIRLAATSTHCAGMLLQLIPEQGGILLPKDSLDFERLSLFFSTLTDAELFTLDTRTLLQRLFAEDDIRLHQAIPLQFSCRCSRERVAQMLLTLGKVEALSLTDTDGILPARCEFCGAMYRFDVIEIEQLYWQQACAPGSERAQ